MHEETGTAGRSAATWSLSRNHAQASICGDLQSQVMTFASKATYAPKQDIGGVGLLGTARRLHDLLDFGADAQTQLHEAHPDHAGPRRQSPRDCRRHALNGSPGTVDEHPIRRRRWARVRDALGLLERDDYEWIAGRQNGSDGYVLTELD
jgi:hypothetical protein